jgi:small subunit ribosomal protein S8
MSVDTIGDFLTIIRNGRMVSKPFVVAPYSKVKQSIANILKNEGFVRGFEIIEDASGKKSLKIALKYVNGESVIHEIVRESTPGLRMYVGAGSIKPVIGGLGLSIITTSRGLLTHKEAKKLGVGGEVICTVW